MLKYLLPLVLLVACAPESEKPIVGSNSKVAVSLYTTFEDRGATCNVYQIDAGTRHVYTTVCGAGNFVATNNQYYCGKNCYRSEEVETKFGN